MNQLNSQMQAITIETNEINTTSLLQQLQTRDIQGMVDGEDEQGRTVLMKVCMIRDADVPLIVKRLLNHHALLDYQDNEEKTVIHYAAAMNRPDVLSVLLTHPADFINRDSNWDLTDRYGRTALFYAAAENIGLLIDAGTAIGHIDNYGMTPLLYYIQQGRNDAVAQFVERCPEQVSLVAPCGQTAIHAAVIMKNYELLAGLVYVVDAGAVKTRNRAGITVMDMAISAKDNQAVDILWASWAFNERDIEHWIGIAASCADNEWSELLKRMKDNRRRSRVECC